MKKKASKGSFLSRAYVRIKQAHLACVKCKPVKARIRRIGGGYKGSAGEFRRTVLAYWKKYGVRPKRYWYALYCARKGAYDPRYVPDSMWYTRILPYYNNLMFRWPYADKGMYSRLFPDVRRPETIVKNIAGYYYDGDGERLIDRAEAERLCEAEEHLIVKPTLNSGSGSGIRFWDREKNDPTIPALFDLFGASFVVQRIVKQHPDLDKINASSLNTVRVITFHFQDEIHVLSSQLRMGGMGRPKYRSSLS